MGNKDKIFRQFELGITSVKRMRVRNTENLEFEEGSA